MLKAIAVLIICLGMTQSVSAKNAHVLEEIDAIKLSDRSQAQRLLSHIQLDQLKPQELYLYRYLKAYLSTFDGDLDFTLDQYEALLQVLPDSVLRIRVLQSALGIASYRENWQQSFELAAELNSLLERRGTAETEAEAYQGLLVFYKNVGQLETAEIYIRRILEHPFANAEHKCFAKSKGVEIKLDKSTVTEAQIYEAIELCKSTEQDYFISTNLISLVSYYISQNELSKARVAAKEAWSKVEPVNFVFLKSQFLATYAKLKYMLGNKQAAVSIARQVIALDKAEQYKASLIIAYELLAKLSAAQNDYQLAYTYVSAVNRLEDDFHNEQVVKSLALQQARFDLKNKETRITLLNKENKLLSTETRLVSEQIQSMIMALGLAVLTVIILLFWSYRTRRVQNKLKYLATTDALTQVANRGHFSEQANLLLSKAKNNHLPVALIFFDLDHFKKINDSHGHQTGDWVLRKVVSMINECCHSNQHLLGRIGGEEFGILMTNTDINTARVFAERCREAISRIDPDVVGTALTVTASFGISDTQQVGYHLEQLFSASDLALYQAKKYGRDQVCTYSNHESNL